MTAFSVAALSFACTLGEGNGRGGDGNDEQAEVTMSFKTPAGATRATIEGDESERTIHSLDLLVFDTSGKFIERRTAQKVQGGNEQFRATVHTGEDLKIHFLANCFNALNAHNPDIFENDTPGFETDWTAVRAALIDTNPAALTGQPVTGLPMWAHTVKTIEKDKVNDLGTVHLLRSTASADVKCNSAVTTDIFTLTSLRLYFAADRGYLTTDPANIISQADPNVIAPEVPAGMTTLDNKPAAADRVLLYDQPAAALATNAILYKMYMYDNDAPIVTTAGRRATRLVIGGKYQGGQETYYPVDFIDPADGETFLDIRRNYKYEFTINSVSGNGYTDPDIASEAFPVNMEIELIPWIHVEHPYIYADGPWWISLERKVSYLPRTAGATDIISIASNIKTDDFELKFKTDDNGTQNVTVSRDGNDRVTSIQISNDRFTVRLIGNEAAAGSELEGYFEVARIEISSNGAYDTTDTGKNTDTLVFTTQYSRIQFEINIYQLDSDPNDWSEGGNQGGTLG